MALNRTILSADPTWDYSKYSQRRKQKNVHSFVVAEPGCKTMGAQFKILKIRKISKRPSDEKNR